MILLLLSFLTFAETTPPFPTDLPPARKSLAHLQNQLNEIGQLYCEAAKTAPEVLARIEKPEYQLMLRQEIVIANVTCHDGKWMGLPQTPRDPNLKALTNQELLREGTFRLYVHYRSVPIAGTHLPELAMKRLKVFESLFSRDIIEAYSDPEKSPVYPVQSIHKWVLEMREILAQGLPL